MRTKQLEIIKCPYCDYEYLPAEIFIAKSFIGTPKNIDRDYAGKILDFDNKSMDTIESYCCDNCNKTFKVSARVNFVSSEAFNDEPYVQHLTKTKLFFNED